MHSDSVPNPPPAGASAEAVEPTRRLAVLDVLRGFALLGVLLVNLPFAALPLRHAMQPAGGAAAPLPELVSWAIVKGLAETKFVSLFSLLFGIGLVLQITRAEARGGSTGFYRRRLFILAVIGLLHGTLLWFGDILLPYAVAGFILYLLRNRSAKTLTRLAIPLFLIGIALSVGLTWLDGPNEAGSARETAEVSESTEAGGSLNRIEARAWTEGPLSLTLRVRATIYAGWLALSSLISFNWHVMALFLLGAGVMKLGLLSPEHRRGHARLARNGLIVGLALEASAIAVWLSSDFAKGPTAAAATLLHEVGSLTLAAGYLGAVVWVVHSGWLRALHTPLAAVGRTALTSYLGQSVAFNLLFVWYGLGLWGQLDRSVLLAVGLGIYGCQMVIAVLWLRSFTMGPCEWLWRWLTYGKRPALVTSP